MPALYLFNKPYGVLSQFTDRGTQTKRETLSDYINVPRIYPAGRLDRDSEGLLLLTDDGRLQARISDPKFKMPKTYLVQVELKDGQTKPAKAKTIAPPDLWPRNPPVRFRKTVSDSWIELTISEGKNRQVRRMTAAIGHPTLRLVRRTIGEWSVEGIAPGQWKQITL
jgi:23S rRNA pseudouridine2457 synthase